MCRRLRIILGSAPQHRAARQTHNLVSIRTLGDDEVAPAVLLAEGQDRPRVLNDSQVRSPKRVRDVVKVCN